MSSELMLIVVIAGQRVVLRAAEVESVIEIEALTPVPLAPVHVAGLAALRSRVLTAIDCCRALDLAPTTCATGGLPAVVVQHEGHGYALLVDAVEDVIPVEADLQPLRTRMAPGWDRVSPGMVETSSGPLLLVDPAAIIAGSATGRVAA